MIMQVSILYHCQATFKLCLISIKKKIHILIYALGEHLSSDIGHQWTPFLCNIQLQSDYVDNWISQWRKYPRFGWSAY